MTGPLRFDPLTTSHTDHTMKTFTVGAIWAAVIKIATMFTPVGLRWAVRLLGDTFAQKQATMPAAAQMEQIPVEAPDGLRTIIQDIFDAINSHVGGRPFVLSVLVAIEKFILDNLIDAIWDTLVNSGGGVTSGRALTTYSPAGTDVLAKALDAAVTEG